jgi:hypothetical protein
MDNIFTWEDTPTELVCYDSLGRVEKRKVKPKLPDGSFMIVFQHYQAEALHAFRGTYVRKGTEITISLSPNGQLNLHWDGSIFKSDPKEGKDFKFV